MLELVGRNGLTEEIPLIGFAALHAEKRKLISGLDALCDNVQLEGAAHPDNGPHDRGIDLTELQILDERLIDLDRIDGKSLKIGERAVPRAEIIDRQSSFQPVLDG